MARWREAECPAGVRWLVRALGAAAIDDAELARAAERFRRGAEVLKSGLAQFRQVFGGFTPSEVAATGEHGFFVLTGVDGKDRPCTLQARVDPAAPHAV